MLEDMPHVMLISEPITAHTTIRNDMPAILDLHEVYS